MNVATHQLDSVEALMRLHDAEGHLIAPNSFIAVAEEAGLIVPLGNEIFAPSVPTSTTVAKTAATQSRSASMSQRSNFMSLIFASRLKRSFMPRKRILKISN